MNVIQPFRRRIIIEALVKGLLFGFMIFGVAMVGVATTYIILHENILAICIGAPIALVLGISVGIPVFLHAKAMKLKVLQYRLDALGLDERVTTMAEFRHDKSYVTQIQREDTMNRLAVLPATTLKIKASKRLISIIAILLVIVMLLFLLATPISAIINPIEPEPTIPPDPMDEIIEDMLEELDKIVDEAPIPEEDKTEMEEIIDEMKEKLEQAETNEEKQEIIRDTANDLQDRVEMDEHNKETIVENLKEQNKEPTWQDKLLNDLADAIENNNKDKLDQTLDEMYKDIMNNPDAESRQEQADKYAEAIEDAIRDTYNDEALKDALQDFADNMSNPENAPYPDKMQDVMEQAKEDISNAMDENQMNKDAFDTMEDARQEMLGNTDKTIEDVLDDLRDVINNSDLSNTDKDELRDMVDDLEQTLDNMKQEGASDAEMSGAMSETREEIYEYIENAKKENNELGDNLQTESDKYYPPELEDAKSELGEAIKNNDKEGIQEALDKLQNHYQPTQPGSPAEEEAIGDIKDIIQEALDKTTGESSMKDALENFVENLEGALESGEDERRENADNAFDQAREELGEAADQNADKQPTAEWMDDILGAGQNSIWNEQEYQKPDKPEPEESEQQGEEGKGEQPPEEENKGENPDSEQTKPDGESSGGSNPGLMDFNFEVWDPQRQETVTLGEYLTLDALEREYDKMFDRVDELTPEESLTINHYYETLRAALIAYRTAHNLPLYSDGTK